MTRPGGDDLPCVFSGTLVARGQGIAKVRATGPESEIGKIGEALGTIETAPPRLKQETGRLVRLVAALGLDGLRPRRPSLRPPREAPGSKAFLAGIALGMSMLPEEFPLVLTVFLVMGAWRISRARVLTRRAAAIETLGEASVLCTDKTGTLTLNRMSIVELVAGGEILKATRARDGLAGEIPPPRGSGKARLRERPFRSDGNGLLCARCDKRRTRAKALADRKAGQDLRTSTGPPRRHPGLEGRGTDAHVVAAKGAPEAIATSASSTPRLSRRTAASADEWPAAACGS